MSENYEGHGYPIASFIHEVDADTYKLLKEREDAHVLQSFKRYYKVVKSPLYCTLPQFGGKAE